MKLNIPSTEELAAREQIFSRISPLPELAASADSLLLRSVRAILESPKDNPAAKVGVLLLSRFANDMRLCFAAGALGYGLQALASTAALMEILGALAFVGEDPERARYWATHSDSKKSYPRTIGDGIDAILVFLNLANDFSRKEWKAGYETACMAKHANPKLALVHGLKRGSDGFEHQVGPDGTEFGRLLAAESYYRAITYGTIAVLVGSAHCSDEKLGDQLRTDALALREQLHRVEPLFQALAKNAARAH